MPLKLKAIWLVWRYLGYDFKAFRQNLPLSNTTWLLCNGQKLSIYGVVSKEEVGRWSHILNFSRNVHIFHRSLFKEFTNFLKMFIIYFYVFNTDYYNTRGFVKIIENFVYIEKCKSVYVKSKIVLSLFMWKII